MNKHIYVPSNVGLVVFVVLTYVVWSRGIKANYKTRKDCRKYTDRRLWLVLVRWYWN